MKTLFEIDLNDYKDTDAVFRRPSARAIIFQGDKIALVYSKKEKYFKFPGGGIHDDEDKKEALIREVREESGMVVIPDSIREFGSVLRRQKSDKSENTIFEQENYYYYCDVQDELVDQDLDDYEEDAGFVLRVVDLDTAIAANDIYTSESCFNEVMIKRELRVLKLIKGEMFNQLSMKKVIVLGCSGSGKSTFAIKLHEKLGLPLYHLDNIWWKADKTHVSRDEFDAKLDKLVKLDSWIIDGDYSRTYEKRIAACDTIFFLNYSEDTCMDGISKRVGQTRPDIPWTEEKIDPELVELVRNYEKENRPKLLELFAQYPEKNVITFKTREEADKWITERQQ
ncbi:NUDIX domain-containing protein [Butyrivibrio sp. LC3010]|uniref:NUDIX domain-containing protein n=1 Tax=Butyrivibrio sp. LC3010 TaxID=1280680 RepID=UPI0018CA46EC|nr:NUDIX domain-containing protein [Butyrivibrio sp. LC3010]